MTKRFTHFSVLLLLFVGTHLFASNPNRLYTVPFGSARVCQGFSLTFFDSTGISSPTTYTWKLNNVVLALPNKDTVNYVFNNPPGAYTIKCIASNGATKDSGTINITVDSLPTAAITRDTAQCLGTPTTLSCTSGYRYRWSTGDTTASISVSPFVDFEFHVTVTNAHSCVQYDSVHVTVHSLPNAGITGANAVCNGTPTTLTATGGTTYLWSTASNANPITVSPTNSTTYSVTVTDANTCTASTSHLLTVNNNPSANIAGTAAICFGNADTLVASGGTMYSWNNATAANTIIVSPTTQTTYTVTVADGNNCTASSSKTVMVNPVPTGIVRGDTVCSGTAINLSLSATVANSTFRWAGNGTQGAGNIVDVPTNTTSSATTINYVVTPTSNQGCVGQPYSIPVLIHPLPTAPVWVDSTAQVCKDTRGVSFSVNPQSGYTYLWKTTPTALNLSGQHTTNASIDFPNASGTIQVIVQVTDANGCKNSTSQSVVVNSNAAHSPANIVLNQPSNTLVLLNNTYDSYQWGYDQSPTYSSNTLAGETNQDYVAGTAYDPVIKFYWVIVKSGGCETKIYYNRPPVTSTGIQMMESVNWQVDLFPNPSNGMFSIQSALFNTPINLRILDELGRIVLDRSVKNTAAKELIKVDATGLPSGIYFLNLTNGNTQINKRFAIETNK